MPNAAIVAAALTDHSARSYLLAQGGLDVLKQPGTPGNLSGVPLESISVTEAGPGGVSSMSYTIEDPLSVWPLPIDGTDVRFYDITSDHPEFLGFVQAVSVRPLPPQGRYFDVECIGVECRLDWAIVSGTFTTTNTVGDAIQSLAAVADLRAFIAAGGSEGTQAAPISGIVAAAAAPSITLTNVTLRDGINSIMNGSALGTPGTLNVTVDFTNGLRVWHTGGSGSNLRPDDYISTTLIDSLPVTGDAIGEAMTYTLNYGEIVRAVRVVGSSDFGTFSDGTGRPGPTAVLNDTTITTAAAAALAAQQYIGQRAIGVRGPVALTDWDEGATARRTGSNLIITDTNLGLTTGTFPIGQIDKAYHGSTREDWTITFGGLPPRGSALLRRLTRNTLS